MRLLAAPLVVAVLAMGCEGVVADSPPMETSNVGRFELSLGRGTLGLGVGERVTLRAQPSVGGAPFTGIFTVSWASSNAAVVSAGADGELRGLSSGTAVVTAKGTRLDTGVEASASVTVTVGGSAGGGSAGGSSAGGSTAGGPSGTGGGGTGSTLVTTFTPDTVTDFPNPERGYYFRVGPGAGCDPIVQKIRDGQIPGYEQPTRLLYYEVNPASFSAATFTTDMACVRDAGMKIIFGEVYCSSLSCDEGVTIEQVESQLAAMKPALAANEDVIAFVRIGVMGGWGEGASWHGGTVPDDVRIRVRDAILAMTPPELALLHRNPMYVHAWYPVATAATAFDGTPATRIGIVNDCFLSGSDDHYTYPDPALRAKTAAHTEFTPFGAETCNGGSSAPNRLSCTAGTLDDGTPGGILNEGKRYHLTYMHRGYYEGFMNTWLQEGCYDEVARSMGYRFELDRLSHPSTATRGGTVTVTVGLHNVGWARIFSARPLVVTFVHRSSGASFTGSGGDARQLPSQSTASSSFSLSVNVPATAPAGEYEVWLSMPDVWPRTSTDARFSVRFANVDVPSKAQAWDSAKARFKTGATMQVQ